MNIRLFGIKFDNNLFLNIRGDVLPCGDGCDFALEHFRDIFKPGDASGFIHLFDGSKDVFGLAQFFFNGDLLAHGEAIGWDIHFFAVNQDVPMADELPRGSARGGKAQPVNNVIKAAFKELHKDCACDAPQTVCGLEASAELAFKETVNAFGALFFAQLNAVGA